MPRAVLLPEIPEGMKRQFYACRTCGAVSYYDYRPYNGWYLGRLPCKHVDVDGFNEQVKRISNRYAQEKA